MATKKDAAQETEQVTAQEPAQETAQVTAQEPAQEPAQVPEKPKSKWDQKVKIYVPRKGKGDDQSWMVMVNDRIMYVPANGKMQELPLPIAKVLQAAVDAEAEAEEYANKVTEQAMNAGNKGVL